MIIILLLVALVAVSVFLLKAEEFKIKEIEIEGNKELTEDEIYELSEIKEGNNIFATLEIVTKVKLKRNGYVEDVKLKKHILIK